MLNDKHIIKNNIDTWQRERLNPLDPLWVCDSLNSDRQDREGDSKKFPRQLFKLVNKATGIEYLISICQNQDPTLNEAAARLGQSMRETEDQLVRDMLVSTASFINAVGGNNGDNPTEISDTDVSDVISTLVGNNAHMILNNIEGEDRFGTQPIRQSFIAMAHSDIISDLDNQLTGFVSKYNYPNQQPTLDSEWGSFRNVRFLVSSVGSVTPNSSALGANVYNIFVAAREAYGIVYQDGASAQFIYRDPMYDGPLALNATVGWKMAQVPRLLNDLWLLNLRVTITT